jgi:GTP:adenosylcobinamide-phosphate guanylyltransferase
VVLAGGPQDAVSALAPGAPNKAFVPIAGMTLVERTLTALRTSDRIGTIVAVAPQTPETILALQRADRVRDDGATMTESLRSGLRDLPPDDLVLVCASDLPILTRDAIDDFIARAESIARGADESADLTYACVERNAHLARYPGVPHTWARLRDGTFCGGGCVAIRPRVLGNLEGLLDRLGRARKNPLRLAAIFGPSVLASYALGRLTIAAAEKRGSELLGASVRAAICPRAAAAPGRATMLRDQSIFRTERMSGKRLRHRIRSGKRDALGLVTIRTLRARGRCTLVPS